MTETEPFIDPALAALLARPGAHLHEVAALDRLGAVLRTTAPGTLVLLYGASAADADAVARSAAQIHLAAQAGRMAADPRLQPVVELDAPFDPKGALDLRFLFAELMGRLGAPPARAQVPPSASRAEVATWARGTRLQMRERADFHLASVAACRGRSVEAVFVRHLERSARHAKDVVPGQGTELLAHFAAAAGVVLVLSGGYEVLGHRTTAAPVEEVRVRRYDPGVPDDVAEFTRVARDALAQIAPDVAADGQAVLGLLAQTLGSVATLRAWTERAQALVAERGPGADAVDALSDSAPSTLAALREEAKQIRAWEARLEREAAVSVDDVLALLTGGGETAEEPAAPAVAPAAPRRHPDGLRPGERGLFDDPVGVDDVAAA